VNDTAAVHGVTGVTDQNYDLFLAASASVVVFGIASCVPCAEFDPILQQAAERYPAIPFGKARMHVPGTCREIKKHHTFDTFPTTHFYRQGQLVHTEEEKLSLDDLVSRIETHLLGPTPA
jgi:hypothetical protein